MGVFHSFEEYCSLKYIFLAYVMPSLKILNCLSNDFGLVPLIDVHTFSGMDGGEAIAVIVIFTSGDVTSGRIHKKNTLV